jgi:threonine aldolase
MVFLHLSAPSAAVTSVVESARAHDVLLCDDGPRLRLVTHLDVSYHDIDRAAAVLRDLLQAAP